MPRYVALLRGVSPMNLKMPELKRCLEAAGFTDVKTLLSSGNAVFTARAASEATLQRKAEKAMSQQLGRTFYTIVRPASALREILDSNPFTPFRLPKIAKRVVTFLRDPPETELPLPLEFDGARILAMHGREIFTAYVPGGRGAAFMTLIEKTFGKNVTTRTWDTVAKCVAAAKEKSRP